VPTAGLAISSDTSFPPSSELYGATAPQTVMSIMSTPTCVAFTGWRINSEVLSLQWRQVDLKAGEVRLDPGTTKNLEGRVFYLTSELKELLKAQPKAADRIQRRKGMIVQHVFLHDVPTKDGAVGFWSGHAIAPSGFYHAWCRARIAAGCPGSIPHDFRSNGDSEHGPRRHSRTRGDEIERPQDP
jgi:integrase